MASEQRDEHEEAGGLPEILEERPTIRPAEPRLDWHRGFVASDLLLVLLGLWLIASPFVLSYGGGDSEWVPVVSGALIALLGVAALLGIVPRLTAAWTVIGLAALLFVSAFTLADTTEATWNTAAAGALAAFLGIVAAAAASAEVEQAG